MGHTIQHYDYPGNADKKKVELAKQALKAKNVRWLVKIEFHE